MPKFEIKWDCSPRWENKCLFCVLQAEELDRRQPMVRLRPVPAVRGVGMVVVRFMLPMCAKRTPRDAGQMSSSRRWCTGIGGPGGVRERGRVNPRSINQQLRCSEDLRHQQYHRAGCRGWAPATQLVQSSSWGDPKGEKEQQESLNNQRGSGRVLWRWDGALPGAVRGGEHRRLSWVRHHPGTRLLHRRCCPSSLDRYGSVGAPWFQGEDRGICLSASRAIAVHVH